MLKIQCLLVAFLPALAVQAQDAHKWLRKGDGAYEKQNYPDAEVNYRRALEKESTTKGTYNLGNATYRQDRYAEAIKHYAEAAEKAKDGPTKAKAYHNLGNAYFNSQQYKESIEAYKNALRLNPSDIGTKQNLANALRRLPPPQDQQQNQQQQQQNKKDQKDQEDKQQQPPQQQPQQDQPQQQDPNKPRPDQGKPSDEAREQPEDMSKEEAAKLLEIMDQEEQNVQQKLRKAQSKGKRPTKDW